MDSKFAGLFDLSHSVIGEPIASCEYPWDILTGLSDEIIKLGKTLDMREFEEISENVWVSVKASIAPTASVSGPCIICEDAEIRHCAFIRGSVIVGKGSVIGNSCEIKNSVIFDSVQVPHFNYIGDSILGYHSHFGAGAITSNVKGDKSNIAVRMGDSVVETGRRKLGAIVGDFAEIGCNCVLNPGAVIGSNTQIYPLNSVRGYVGDNMIMKSKDNIVEKHANGKNNR